MEADSHQPKDSGTLQAIFLGRDLECDLIVDDPYVSPYHCRITWYGDDRYFIEDLGSTNGTWLIQRSGAVRVYGQTALHPGYRICIGHTEIPWHGG